MYLRGVHADAGIPSLRQLIRSYPLGILTTALRSDNAPFIQSSHIPFLLDVRDEGDESELGTLRGHLARQNPQSKAMIETLKSQSSSNVLLDEEAQVLFTSDVQHYVTPKFYVDTKPDTGKVVPTWNYAAAQVYGKARIYWDHQADESARFLSKQIDDLSAFAETSIMGYDGVGDNLSAWKVSDAPPRYIELIQKNIIGIEIEITRLEGKFKMSQEMSVGDRDGVIQGFDRLGSDLGQKVSSLVKERGDLKDSLVK